jgi:hypothetical protein
MISFIPSRGSVTTLLALALTATLAVAQPTGFTATAVERGRILETTQQLSLRGTEYLRGPARDYTIFDNGGWSSTSYFNFKDFDNNRQLPDAFHGLLISDIRYWFKAQFPNDAGVYIRFRKQNFHFYTRDDVLEPDTNKVDAFDLDIGYIELPFNEAQVRVGRQFLQIGRGLTFSDVLDCGSVDFRRNSWQVNAFSGRTSPMADNIDASVAPFGTGGAKRWFTGVQVNHTNEDGHRIYGYYLNEVDRTRSVFPQNLNFNHHFNADFVAIGWEGPLAKKLTGYAELIHEGGSILSQNLFLDNNIANTTRDDLDATALISALSYFAGDVHRSNIGLEFAYGSGDRDRGSVFNTFINGNRPGTTDTGFFQFGVYDLGLALSPRLSNLEVLRLGYSLKPILNHRREPIDLQAGVKVSGYWKDEATGAIAPTTLTQANQPFTAVGTGLDVFVNGRIFHDQVFSVQYGKFYPSSAYMTGFDDPQSRLFVNLTSSF